MKNPIRVLPLLLFAGMAGCQGEAPTAAKTDNTAAAPASPAASVANRQLVTSFDLPEGSIVSIRLQPTSSSPGRVTFSKLALVTGEERIDIDLCADKRLQLVRSRKLGASGDGSCGRSSSARVRPQAGSHHSFFVTCPPARRPGSLRWPPTEISRRHLRSISTLAMAMGHATSCRPKALRRPPAVDHGPGLRLRNIEFPLISETACWGMAASSSSAGSRSWPKSNITSSWAQIERSSCGRSLRPNSLM